MSVISIEQRLKDSQAVAGIAKRHGLRVADVKNVLARLAELGPDESWRMCRTVLTDEMALASVLRRKGR